MRRKHFTATLRARTGPFHFDGQCLLMENQMTDGYVGGAIYFVFVRADDDAAVENHLRRSQ